MSRLVVIVRGLPGSGKSTLVRQLTESMASVSGTAHVFSTDDFFMRQVAADLPPVYEFDVKRLSEAHEHTQMRFRQAMEQNAGLLIVDNTNVMFWECKYYVQLAHERGYEVQFMEPQTPWWLQRDIDELARRNTHGVTRDKIEQMMQRWEQDISLENVLASEQPVYQRPSRRPERPMNTQTAARREQCRFFVQGRCRYGTDCRFAHS